MEILTEHAGAPYLGEKVAPRTSLCPKAVESEELSLPHGCYAWALCAHEIFGPILGPSAMSPGPSTSAALRLGQCCGYGRSGRGVSGGSLPSIGGLAKILLGTTTAECIVLCCPNSPHNSSLG